MRAPFATLIALALGATAGAAINQEALDRVKSVPGPMQSSDGTLYVGCRNAERADMRWPVLRFADGVRENLSDTFAPLGSPEAPLYIVLGTETNRVENVVRRSVAAADGFSQLVILVPNPDTVDLEVLRESVAEAYLRERARALGGSYAALKWPRWFIRAMVDASRGNVWQAEAYEAAHRVFAQGGFPDIDDLFAPDAAPPREVAAFFARWVLERNPTDETREALLSAPWERTALVGDAEDKAWPEWFRAMEDAVFVPGTLTRSQFQRWTTLLTKPTDAQDAIRISNQLTRQAIGRPQVFRDLTELYLRAYGAFAMGDEAGYAKARAEADEARAAIEQILSLKPILQDLPPQESVP